MKFFKKGFFKKLRINRKFRDYSKGIIIFENTSLVIKAEKALKSAGYQIKMVAPPPIVRKGCDLAIEVPIIKALSILEFLKMNKINYLDFIPCNKEDLLKPVDIFQIKDFGKYLMVRAANMKLTVDKESLTIVNISGGGCPDVPYLASKLIGLNLTTAPQPKELANTLCGYALQLAYEKIKEILCLS